MITSGNVLLLMTISIRLKHSVEMLQCLYTDHQYLNACATPRISIASVSEILARWLLNSFLIFKDITVLLS